MNLSEPDKRLRDVEVLLRCMSFLKYATEYKGNLLQFLDNTTRTFNKNWDSEEKAIIRLKDRVMSATEKLYSVFDSYDTIARKYKNGEQYKQFNRVIFEVLVYFFDKIDENYLTTENNARFIHSYQELFANDTDFQATIDGSTKNLENYKIRYSRIRDIVEESYGVSVNSPFEYVKRRVGKKV